MENSTDWKSGENHEEIEAEGNDKENEETNNASHHISLVVTFP